MERKLHNSVLLVIFNESEKMMGKIFSFFLIALLGFRALNATGSDTSRLVKYTPDFYFSDGIFLDYKQFEKNNPVAKARILTTIDYDDNDFFKKITEQKTFSFYDDFGKKFDIPTKSIWGYADNGILHVNVNQEFFRVTIVGAICHFVAYVTSYNYSPSPYYSPYNRYNTYSYSPTYRNEKTDLRQYVIEFRTGKILEYSINNLEVLLLADTELYEEFIELRKKKKKQKAFYYIRKFNERNPIYFPANGLTK
jgi:hypothetical protein